MTLQPLETRVHSRMFFDRKHSKTVPVFIFSILFMLLAFFVWAATMKMDDVVKAQALLRPVDTISIIRCLAGGEVPWEDSLHLFERYFLAMAHPHVLQECLS